MKKFESIDEYHATFPGHTKQLLQQIRELVKQEIPEIQEVISYNMPAFKLKKVLVYYAAYEKHIGFYPTPLPIQIFKDRLTNYKTSKGAIQFPLNQKLPESLIRDIVRFRLKQVSENQK